MIAKRPNGKKILGAVLGLAALAQVSISAAYADEHFDGPRHNIDVHHGYPHGYAHGFVVPRDRFYHGFHIYRAWGPLYPGFGWFYDDAAAWAFLGFTAWQLAIYNEMNEEQLRAQEAAIVQASSAPVGEPVVWNDGPATGQVETVREGHTPDGRACREFQQDVTIAGKSQQAFGTACQQPDGSWQLVHQP